MKKIILLLVIASLFSLFGCAATTSSSKDQRKDLLSYNKAVEVKTISILNESGTINIGKSTSNNVEIECFVSYGGKSAQENKKIIEQFSVSPQITDDILYLEVDTQGGIDIENWLKGEIDYINVNYDIKLPDYIDDIRVINVMGNINVKDVETSFYMESQTGNFDLQNVTPMGNSHLNMAKGNIGLNASDISNAQIISSWIGFGNVTYNLPKDADYITGNTAVPDPIVNKSGEGLFSEKEIVKYKDMLMRPIQNETNTFEETMIVCKVDSGNVKIVGESSKTEGEITPEKQVNDININHPNNYLAKYNNGYTYVSGVDKLYRIDSKDNTWESIYEGNITLGAFYENALYFLAFPSNADEINEDKNGVFKLDLESLESEQILPWDDDYWIYNTIQIEGDNLFLSSKLEILVYSIAEKQWIENYEEVISLPDNLIQRMDKGELSLLPNMVFNYYSKDIIAYFDNAADNETLYVHKVKENTELEFEGVYNDVLFVQDGFVYRNEDRSKVYFVDYDKNTKLLYDSEETNSNINYGTYDQNYLYCVEENKEENKVVCYRISWNGEKEKLFETVSSKGAVLLNLTVINNFLYYYDEGKEKVVGVDLANI